MLVGCVSTSQMQVAPNAYRIESEAGGLLFMGQAGDQTLKRAAELTVANGYTHFVIADASYGRSSRVVGLAQAPVYGSATMAGNTVYASAYGGGTQVVRAPTESAAATVVMYRESDTIPQNAFDARTVLKSLQSAG